MKKIFVVFIIAISVLTACKKMVELGEAPRLFRPVIVGALNADSNTIVASWQQMNGAKSYEVQLSRDSFRTVDAAVRMDSNTVVFKKLLFNQLYQIQVKAIAPDTAKNSYWSNLGAIKTLSSILKTPGISDITFNSVRVSWSSKGAAVTSIKVLKTSDSSVVANVSLTAADLTNEFKVINGLAGDTKYTILLYSGADLRGNVDFNTKAPFAGVIIDLTGISGIPSILTDTLPNIPSGSTVLLKRGETYNVAATVNLSKSITIMSGPDLSTNAQAKIFLTGNFSVANSSTIDYIDFKDVYLQGGAYGSNYVFNTSSSGVSANIGRLSFEDCKAEIFRGMIRTQSAAGVNITNFKINNCVIDSLSGYGIITVDNAAGKVENISITNSTIYKVEKLVTSSKVGSVSVIIDNCTVNESPLGSNYYVDYGSFTVDNGITISNCVFGVAKNGGISVRGYRAAGGTVMNTTNNYRTSEQVNGGGELPNIITHSKPATLLWQDPLNGNFKIIDAGFAGKNSAGDPRWRP